MGRVHAKPKQSFLGWCFKSAFLPTYRYVFALMPQSQACVKVFELCCSNLHKSCRSGLRLEHQALEKEGCKQCGLLLWPAISCILLSGPVVFFSPPAVSMQVVSISRLSLLLCVCVCQSCCLSWRLWAYHRDKSMNGWWGPGGLALPCLMQRAWEAALEVVALQAGRDLGTK